MKRILSIDGGGIRGTFPAAFLANLEKDLDQPIGSYFDLIAGTSTGGIIAIGLALGLRAQTILELYEEKGPAIFSQTQDGLLGLIKRHLHNGKWLVGPKYTTQALEDALKEVFGGRRLGESKTRLMIPSFHSQTQNVYIFKTAHNERLATDYKDLAVDAALATAAAPTYFQQHITANDVGLVDGGLWANNPTGIAVVEAIGTLGWPADQLQILSVGCLEDIAHMKHAYGAVGFAQKMAGFFMAGQSYGSLGIAHILTGDPHTRKAVYRVSQPVPDGFFSLDDTRKIRQLKDRAFAEARIQKPQLESVFFRQPAEPFLPIHSLKEA
jgi:patatin-like phospholipase/acyl hydrolase